MSRIDGDLTVGGTLTPKYINLPAGSVSNNSVEAGAAMDADKLEHQHQPCYAQESDTTAAAEDFVLHVIRGATGQMMAFSAGCVVANIGAAVVTVDLHKNGSSMLTAAITIDSGDAAYAIVEGTIDPAKEDLVVGDVLELVVTVAAGGGTLGKGVFAQAVIVEDAA